LAALAFLCAGVRRERPRFFAYAGALVVLAVLTSLDFGAYSFITLAAAVLIARGMRRSAAIAALAGVSAAGVVVVVALASFGILGAFVRTTLFEIVPIGTASSLGMPPPMPLPFPDVLTQVFTPRGFPLIALAVFLVALAAALEGLLPAARG